MNDEQTKMMQEALQAAMSQMGQGQSQAPGIVAEAKPDLFGSPEKMAMLMGLFRKLMENNKSDLDDEPEVRSEPSYKEDFDSLRKQLRALRKEVHVLMGAHRQILETQQELVGVLRIIHEQQDAAGGAVMELAEQLARLQIVDEPSQYAAPLPVPEAPARGYRGDPGRVRTRATNQ